jgi:tellurite resistance protein
MLERSPPAAPGASGLLPWFGMVLGLGGLSNAWRAAEALWKLPTWPSAMLGMAAALCWLLSWVKLLALLRTARGPHELRSAASEPLFALAPMSTLVLSLVLHGRLASAAQALFALGVFAQLWVGVECSARLWRGDPPATLSSVSLMPTVGGFFLAALAAATFGFTSGGRLLFGAALLSWLVTESIVLARLMAGALDPRLRSTLGVHVTPPAIAAVAWLALDPQPPALPAQLLFGYALLQALVLLRSLGWLRLQTFSISTWAYTFGASALAVAGLRFTLLGSSELISLLGVPLFVGANVLIGWIALRTLALGWRSLRGPNGAPSVDSTPHRAPIEHGEVKGAL